MRVRRVLGIMKWVVVTVVLVLVLLPGAGSAGEPATLDERLVGASARGNVALVKSLLDKGAEVEAKDEFGQTALMLAARTGNLQIVKLLIGKGAYVNGVSRRGETPVFYAARSGKIDVVRLLIGKGADAKAVNEHGRTAQWAAELSGRCDVAQYLRSVSAPQPQRVVADETCPPYPDNPKEVVQHFINTALRDLPITAEEMTLGFEILSPQAWYLPKGVEHNTLRKSSPKGRFVVVGPNPIRLHIATGFEIEGASCHKNRATVKVVYRRLGWISDLPVNVAACRSRSSMKDPRYQKPSTLVKAVVKIGTERQGWVWDKEGCRILHITNDFEEVSYHLARPGKFWRVVGSYEPHISVGSATKMLKCWLIARPDVSRSMPSDEQRTEIAEHVRILEEHLGQ